jgi:TfoX/Sxy family transcriptional regulator of competence genes
MAYDEKLVDRIREALVEQKNVAEKKMFGGVAFMVNDKMCVGVTKDDLMARIDPDVQDKALQKEGSRVMDFTGRPMKGFVFVSPEGVKTKKELEYWLNLALDYNAKAKPAKKRK